VLEQGRCEPSELVAGEIVWEVVEGVLGVDRVPVDDPWVLAVIATRG